MSDYRVPPSLSRRRFLAIAATIGAAAAWASRRGQPSRLIATEARALYPEGVASGDPDLDSVLLWTRRPYFGKSQASLRVEVSEDEKFTRVLVAKTTSISAASDWTCRVLVGNLEPSHVYWYRFVDDSGGASRIGRTITAPAADDTRPVRFAFVSCQNVNQGAQHAYRRMIYEDERAADTERLGFVLHLGDFIYEVVWYPEDRPGGVLDGRRLRDIVRYPHGEKIGDFHVPTTLEDYRAVYRAYLHDPDLQDARARWPFVCIWDNHEFSMSGWQTIATFNGKSRPVQTRKVAANQAWFEYQPARILKSSGPSLEQFDPPVVRDEPITRFDAHGFGDEPNSRLAIGSLTGYRALSWGPHVELMLTDQHSYRSEDPLGRPEAKSFSSEEFPVLYPQEVLEVLDAGRAYAAGRPPKSISFGDRKVPNFRREGPPQTILGAQQKRWFLQRLRRSKATWKIWGNTVGTLDARVDLQNLPAGLGKPWPGSGYAVFQMADYSTAYQERADIYAAIRDEDITGFVTVSGNSHSFWAGLAAPSLPPRPFEAVGAAFVTGSISSPGIIEHLENNLPKDHPLRPLYLLQRPGNLKLEPTFNLLIRHGVRACLEYQRTGDLEQALRVSNPELSPHLSFLDLCGHGYAIVRAFSDSLECEFVCIPRPMEHAAAPDGGPLRYRVMHRLPRWEKGEKPRLEQHLVYGNSLLSV